MLWHLILSGCFPLCSFRGLRIIPKGTTSFRKLQISKVEEPSQAGEF